MPEERKMAQLRAVLDDLGRFPKSTPAIVMGDFNSWEPAVVDRVRDLFTDEGWTTPFKDEDTFQRKIVMFDLNLKLDWIWLRGLLAQSYGVDRTITVSDHFPLWTVVGFSKLSASDNRR
jgi:endonuclease/exonuclease/phosphatase (EEP) superfamily protein YafD